MWTEHYELPGNVRVQLRPHTAGSDLLELGLHDRNQETLANVIFTSIQDRRGQNLLSIRDQNTFDTALRKKRLMTVIHLFLIHRYKASAVHYVSPTEDNRYQTQKMKDHGLYTDVHDEVGQIIVALVNAERISELLEPDRTALLGLIDKTRPPSR